MPRGDADEFDRVKFPEMVEIGTLGDRSTALPAESSVSDVGGLDADFDDGMEVVDLSKRYRYRRGHWPRRHG